MAKFYLSVLAICFLATASYSAVRTVSNNPNIPAQYTNLQTAMDDSSPGDTIYVSWSVTSYGDITLNKPLVIIGDGYNQGLQGRSATIGDLNLNQIDNDNNCSNSIIQGLSINQVFSRIPLTGKKIENLAFIRNRFRSILYYYNPNTSAHRLHSDWYFKDCVFENHIYFANTPANRYVGASNMIFSNCVFQRTIYYMGNACAFMNCMFIDFWKSTAMFDGVENALFTSCIFMSPPRTVNNSTFNNCLTFSSGDNTIPYGTNTGENNIINENPKFINVPTKTNGEFNYAIHNAKLQSDSPAIGTGLDGVDMGVFGGVNPIPDFSGEPPLPVITSMTILNSVVGKNGSLRFKINAKNNK